MESYRIETIIRERYRRLTLPELTTLIIRLRDNLPRLGLFLDDFEACLAVISSPIMLREVDFAAEMLRYFKVFSVRKVTVTAARCAWLAGKVLSYEESLGLRAVVIWLNRNFTPDMQNPVNDLRRLEYLGRNVFTRINACSFRELFNNHQDWLEKPEEYFSDAPALQEPDPFGEDVERIYSKRFGNASLFRHPMTLGRLERVKKMEEDILTEAVGENLAQVLEDGPGVDDICMSLQYAEFLTGHGQQEAALRCLVSAFSANGGRVSANFILRYTKLLLAMNRPSEAISTIETFMKARFLVLWHPDVLMLMKRCRDLYKKRKEGLLRACYWERRINESLIDFRQHRFTRIKASWKVLFHELDSAMAKAAGF